MNRFTEFIDDLLKQENILPRLVCVLLACGLWVYVMSIENPIAERNVEIRLQQENLEDGMIVTKSPEKVIVRVRGNRNRLVDGLENNVHASINLSKAKVGEQKFPVHVFFNDGEVVSVQPSNVTVMVDTVTSKTVPVSTRIVGGAAEDMTLGNVHIVPSSAVVTGASQIIRGISKAVAPVDVSNQEKEFKIDSELIAVGDNGYDVPNVKITPARVNVTASMVKQMLTVELPVEIVMAGTLPADIKVTKTEIVPEKVRITAAPSVLKGMTVIKTKPLDLSNLHGSAAPALELDVPDKAIPEARVVQVRLSVEKAAAASTDKKK